MGNMGAMGGMGGGMNPMAAAMGMGGMGGMGAMGGASGGGQQAFDPYAMSQFFKQVSTYILLCSLLGLGVKQAKSLMFRWDGVTSTL